MITREQFKKIIKLMREQDEEDDKISKLLQKNSGCHFFFNSENKKYIALRDLLDIVFNDDEDSFCWWYYEGGGEVTFDDGKKMTVETDDEFYDYMMEMNK